jgi:hypothetical protein
VDDRPRNRQPTPATPSTPTETELRAAVDQSDQDVAAGLTVPLAEVLSALDDVADRLETRRRTRRA